MCSKKLIIVTGHSKYDSGGVGTHLRLLTDSLKKKNILNDVVMGCGYIGRGFNFVCKLSDKFLGLNKAYEALSPLINILFLEKQIENTIKRNGKDNYFILHCHDRSSTIASYRLKDKYKIKIVQTVHAPFSLQYIIHPIISKSLTPLYICGLDESTCNFADHYIAVDELQKELILKNYNDKIDSKKITVIHNAVESELLKIDNHLRKDYFIVARHLHQKNGIEYAIRAFSYIKKEKSGQLKLKILGQGPLEGSLKKIADDLGVSNFVEFLGAQPRSKCISLISNALGSIVPSVPVGDYVEATSLTMLESMALKTPLIASNIGGIKEVLDGKGAAFLVEPRNCEGIYVAMKKIIDNHPEVQIKTSKGYSIIKNSYTLDIWMDKIVDVYNK